LLGGIGRLLKQSMAMKKAGADKKNSEKTKV
jgi:hypothetical protein